MPIYRMEDQRQRTFDAANDARRVNVVAGNISINPGDIQIGAVEIKDHDSNDRASVLFNGAEYALLVQDVLEAQKTKVNDYAEGLVAAGASLTLISKTIAASTVLHIKQVTGGGDGPGIFEVEINGSKVTKFRNSGAERTKDRQFIEPPTASPAQVVNVTVTNCDNIPRNFEVTLSGMEVPQ